MSQLTPCTNCAKDTDNLALFPGKLCLDCYSLTYEARRPITAQELTRMWGGRL